MMKTGHLHPRKLVGAIGLEYIGAHRVINLIKNLDYLLEYVTPKNKSLESPPKPPTYRKLLILKELFGRRNWTRTNDPHHVKVVL